VAEETAGKAELADQAADEALAAAIRTAEKIATARAEEAKRAAREASARAEEIARAKAEETKRAAKEATTRAEEIARLAREAAEQAMAKAEEALVKAVVKRLTQWEWIATLVVINLAIVFGAVMLAVALVGAL